MEISQMPKRCVRACVCLCVHTQAKHEQTHTKSMMERSAH